MVKRYRKYESGEGARYLTRKAALKKLQLTLKDFRTLCIMKGIYPREPKHRRRAQKGKTGIQTLYLKKDIQFLLHEPLIWKLREKKVHLRRIRRAKGMKDYSMSKRYTNTIPILDMDHIIKERYPTFIDALRDLDDCLTLCFTFASLPRFKLIPSYLIAMCRRLTIEFMHVVIAARALRAVFISIKGIYYQVELRGQTITWLVSHDFAFQPQATAEVDFETMTSFAEFYSTLLGFVNFRLYHTLNLRYPPQLQGFTTEELESELIDDRVSLSEKVGALNIPLKRTVISTEDADEDVELDQFPLSEDAEIADKAREKFEEIKNLKKLFEGMKIFLNREVPRECLVFVLRSCGAEVSWDKTTYPDGALFEEDDESITHQIVDRPKMEKQYISRYYIQPQWVFDSINARKLMPVEKYFMGQVLPPHLSPFFVEHKTQRYMPPEERILKDPNYKMPAVDEADESENEQELARRVEEMLADEKKDAENSENEEDEADDGEIPDKLKNMKVEPGKTFRINKAAERKDFRQMHKLKEQMIQKKYRNLYKSMKKGRAKREKEIKLLKYKRKQLDRKSADEKRAARQAERVAAMM